MIKLKFFYINIFLGFVLLTVLFLLKPTPVLAADDCNEIGAAVSTCTGNIKCDDGTACQAGHNYCVWESDGNKVGGCTVEVNNCATQCKAPEDNICKFQTNMHWDNDRGYCICNDSATIWESVCTGSCGEIRRIGTNCQGNKILGKTSQLPTSDPNCRANCCVEDSTTEWSTTYGQCMTRGTPTQRSAPPAPKAPAIQPPAPKAPAPITPAIQPPAPKAPAPKAPVTQAPATGSCNAAYQLNPPAPVPGNNVSIKVSASTSNLNCVVLYQDNQALPCQPISGGYGCQAKNISSGSHTLQLKFGQRDSYPRGTDCGAPVTCNSYSYQVSPAAPACNRCSVLNAYQRTKFNSTDASCAQVLPASNPIERTCDCSCPAAGLNTTWDSACAAKCANGTVPAAPACKGDFNSDNKVDDTDFDLWLNSYLAGNNSARCGSGKTDLGDFYNWWTNKP